MTQQECLDKTGEAFGVMEADGTTNWHDTWISAELARYTTVISPDELARRKAIKLEALAKGRQVKADKKAELKRLATEKCPRGCGHTLSMCVCDVVQAVAV